MSSSVRSSRSTLTLWFAGAVVLGVYGISLLASDESVMYGASTPKIYGLVLAVASALAAGAVVWAVRPGTGKLHVTALEAAVLAGLVWKAATAPEWMLHPSRMNFWVACALFGVLALLRQLTTTSADAETSTRRAWVTAALLHALWMGATLQAVLALRQGWAAGQFQYADGLAKTPLVGTLESPNALGSVLALGIVAGVALIHRSRSTWRRTGLGMTVGAVGFALVVGGSRGAMLGLAGAGAVLGVIHLHQTTEWTRQTRRLAILALALGGAAVGLAAALYAMNPASAEGRLLVWRISGPMLADHPVAGVGAGAFDRHYLDYQAAYLRDPAHADRAHQAADLAHPLSQYVQAFVETGIVGGALFLLVWALALWGLSRTVLRNKQPATQPEFWLMGLLLVVLIHGFVDRSLHFYAPAAACYVVLALVPARSVSLGPLGRTGRIALAVGAVGMAAWLSQKTVRQYPGYQLWAESMYLDGPARVEGLEEAQIRLPGYGELELALGRALVDVGQSEEAISVLYRAERDIADRDLDLALGEAHLARGRLDQAEEYALKVAAAFPDQLTPHLLLGRIYQAQGREAEARAALLRCIRRETHVHSILVDAVARRAEEVWLAFYGASPPNE